MDSNLLRRLALYSGAVIAGSINPDIFRFTPWPYLHNIPLPTTLLIGIFLAWGVGQIAESILRREK